MVDFGLTAKDYAKYRIGFPNSIFSRLKFFGVGLKDQIIIDLGTGTGTLARGFARLGCKVIGIDPSDKLLAQAIELDKEAGDKVDYKLATAEDTGLPDRLADVVCAGQCWHWFDRPKAAKEIFRILKTDGKLVITHFDWLPLAGNIVAETEALILKHNPSWKMSGGTGIYSQWLVDLGEANFEELQTFSYDVDILYSPESWRGRIRASAGVGASLPKEKVDLFDLELGEMIVKKFPGDLIHVPHRVWAVIGKKL